MSSFFLRLLPFLLIAVVVAEVYLLIAVGSRIGALPLVALLILAALSGGALLRRQGAATLQRLQASMTKGEPPAAPLLEGVVAAVGAVLLMVPGFLSDLLALPCLIPPIRRRLVRWIVGRGALRTGSTGVGEGTPPRDRGGRTLDGEYWQEDERR